MQHKSVINSSLSRAINLVAHNRDLREDVPYWGHHAGREDIQLLAALACRALSFLQIRQKCFSESGAMSWNSMSCAEADAYRLYAFLTGIKRLAFLHSCLASSSVCTPNVSKEIER
jgi:hypothetical protein